MKTRNRWIFLNLEKTNYEEKDKVAVARDVNKIEYLANEFLAENIISKGINEILKIRDEVKGNKKLQNDYEIAKMKRKTSPGIIAIKQRLGVFT